MTPSMNRAYRRACNRNGLPMRRGRNCWLDQRLWRRSHEGLVMNDIDAVIAQVTNLYRVVTGGEIPVSDAVFAPIPPERDPLQHVHEEMERLMRVIANIDLRGTTAAQSVMPWQP